MTHEHVIYMGAIATTFNSPVPWVEFLQRASTPDLISSCVIIMHHGPATSKQTALYAQLQLHCRACVPGIGSRPLCQSVMPGVHLNIPSTCMVLLTTKC